MWSRKATTVEVHPLGEHPWKRRDEMKEAVLTQNADFVPWQQRLLYQIEDCVEQVVEQVVDGAIAGTKKIAQSVKQAAKNWWQKNSPAIGVKVASAAIAGFVLITDVAEKLGG